MRIAITSNGPGETMGWVRPLAHALYRRVPDLDLHVFFSPCEYASGHEAQVVREQFPRATAYTPGEYLRFAVGGSLRDVDALQYLGGDLAHAALLARKFHAPAYGYKFGARKRKAIFTRIFAIDERNRDELVRAGARPEDVTIVGNLAIDGALDDARHASELEPGGIVILPGSRREEVANLIPFFLRAAVEMRRLAPELPIGFALSPFTTREEVQAALTTGGDPLIYGARGRAADGERGLELVDDRTGERFAVTRHSAGAMAKARLVVTIPGTKTVEAAALGAPFLACVPFNLPEKVVVNGALTYLDRIPLVGIPLKRAVILKMARRFPLTAQPNIDLGEMAAPELRGTLMPAHVARVALDLAHDDQRLRTMRERLGALYVSHRGAADRMAGALLKELSA
ncbi:MAG TPA: hypothetical protein VNJ51_10165 [Candidatus Dormibacteraeota bacterium]|nr:hypothetical protein [Candidatus Dormibacteraeota bacterium]